MAQQDHINRFTLNNRYLFKGKLVMQTALHIGGGRVTLSNSNSPVVLTPEGIPFIPGSSFKGSVRSTIEKIVPNLPGNLRTCSLIEQNDVSDEDVKKARAQSTPICSTARQSSITKERRAITDKKAQEQHREQVLEDLCHTCQLFGSPFAASHIAINDLYMPKGEWNDIIQQRDGVAIDRDSEKAKDRLKYDFEVVPASATFDLEITLENATPQDLQLISVGLSEFVHGFGTIGGKRSRGLGACTLEDLSVYTLELNGTEGTTITEKERNKRLSKYLLAREREDKFSRKETGQDFLEKYINQLFKGVSQ